MGRLNIRKNLVATIESYIASDSSRNYPLVVVGDTDGKTSNLTQISRDAIQSGRVIFLGSISDAELHWLYRNCRMFVFLSLGEGFGLPPAEALLLSDAPLLVSDIPVFRETLGSHARFVNPTDRNAVSSAIDSLVAEARPEVPTNSRSKMSWHGREEYVWTGVAQRIRKSICQHEYSSKHGLTTWSDESRGGLQ
ncbi:hypothetical protein B1964_27785 [Gordonia sp. i37]|nr:hypothetical protein B1964_27785 [Gordonia sp. i37]